MYFRSKKRECLNDKINELAAHNKNKIIGDLYRLGALSSVSEHSELGQRLSFILSHIRPDIWVDDTCTLLDGQTLIIVCALKYVLETLESVSPIMEICVSVSINEEYNKIASTDIICSGQSKKSCLLDRKIVDLTLNVWWDLNHTMGCLLEFSYKVNGLAL